MIDITNTKDRVQFSFNRKDRKEFPRKGETTFEPEPVPLSYFK